jgi:ribosomal protein L11 methyltransferase
MAIAWTEVLVLAPVEWLELVAEALHVGPCTSVAFGRPSLGTDEPPAGFDYVRTYLAEQDDTRDARLAVVSALEELGRRSGQPELAGLEPHFRRLPAEDFATSWRKSWKPMRVGSLCIVPPEWSGRLRASDRKLVLEPGGAFGTGRHATTRMCLALVQAHVRTGARIVDAGSGSGILSVAAVVFGARSALGFDVDPNAQVYARELAAMNGVQDRCEFLTAGFDALSEHKNEFDAAVANIYSDIIQEHASTLHRSLAPGGWFAFSGCPVQHVEKTSAAIRSAGLAIEDVLVRGRWHTYFGRKGR